MNFLNRYITNVLFFFTKYWLNACWTFSSVFFGVFQGQMIRAAVLPELLPYVFFLLSFRVLIFILILRNSGSMIFFLIQWLLTFLNRYITNVLFSLPSTDWMHVELSFQFFFGVFQGQMICTAVLPELLPYVFSSKLPGSYLHSGS